MSTTQYLAVSYYLKLKAGETLKAVDGQQLTMPTGDYYFGVVHAAECMNSVKLHGYLAEQIKNGIYLHNDILLEADEMQFETLDKLTADEVCGIV